MKDWRLRAQSRLKVLKQQDGFTQKDLARALNRSQQAVSAWFTGVREPSIEDLEAIAEALNVTTEWLMHGIGAPDPVTNEILHILAEYSPEEREALLRIIKR